MFLSVPETFNSFYTAVSCGNEIGAKKAVQGRTGKLSMHTQMDLTSPIMKLHRHEKTWEHGSTAPGNFFRIAEIIEGQNVEIVLEIVKLGQILIK